MNDADEVAVSARACFCVSETALCGAVAGDVIAAKCYDVFYDDVSEA